MPLQGIRHVAKHRPGGHQIEVLEDHADLPAGQPQLLGGKSGHLLAVYDHRAVGGPFQQIDAPDQGRLAGTGKTDDAEDLAVLDRQRHIPHGPDHLLAGAKVFGYMGKLDQGRSLLT